MNAEQLGGLLRLGLGDPEVWIATGLILYYVYGFVIVRHIYADDEQRLGPIPFNRMAHVVLFVIPIAVIWPVPALNWYFRESEEAASRKAAWESEKARRTTGGGEIDSD